MRANGAANRAKQQNNALFTMNSYYSGYSGSGCSVGVCEQSMQKRHLCVRAESDLSNGSFSLFFE
jgi:hypothetical protein